MGHILSGGRYTVNFVSAGINRMAELAGDITLETVYVVQEVFKRMYARVKAREAGKYYKSIVYGLVNCGYYEEAIVLNPLSGCFEIVSYFDRSLSGKAFDPFRTGYEVIDPSREGWIKAGSKEMRVIRPLLRRELGPGATAQMIGYADLLSDADRLAGFLNDRSMPVDEAWFSVRQLPDIREWNYIDTQADADAFMKLFAGFHDSTLDRMVYEEEWRMTRLTATFDNSGWYGIVELRFEGVTEINIRPPKENCDRYISCAMLRVVDETVVWADTVCDNVDEIPSDCDSIKALSLKWRKL